jgi:hypothetical protein
MTKKTLAKTWLSLAVLSFLSVCAYSDVKLLMLSVAIVAVAVATIWSLVTLDES